MQGKDLNKRFSTEVQWLGLSTVIKTVNFQCNDQRHVEYVKINRYRQLALDGVVDTHMDFTSSGAGSSPTYGGPQLSRKKTKTSRQNQSYFAVKYLVLPWGILFLPWGFWFCREVFCFCREVFGFAIMFLFLPWGFWFRCEVFGFAVRYFVFAVTFLVLPWQLWATIPYISYLLFSFFSYLLL